MKEKELVHREIDNLTTDLNIDEVVSMVRLTRNIESIIITTEDVTITEITEGMILIGLILRSEATKADETGIDIR